MWKNALTMNMIFHCEFPQDGKDVDAGKQNLKTSKIFR